MRTRGRRREGEKKKWVGNPFFDCAPICRGAVAGLGQGRGPTIICYSCVEV